MHGSILTECLWSQARPEGYETPDSDSDSDSDSGADSSDDNGGVSTLLATPQLHLFSKTQLATAIMLVTRGVD